MKPVNIGRTERVGTTLAGGVLAVAGLARGGWLGYSLAGTGAALVARGVSGRCPVYRALGLSSAPEPGERFHGPFRADRLDDVAAPPPPVEYSDPVDVAVDDSFPASDPPASNAGRDRPL